MCAHVYQVWKTVVVCVLRVLMCACMGVHCVSMHVCVHGASKPKKKTKRQQEKDGRCLSMDLNTLPLLVNNCAKPCATPYVLIGTSGW